MTNVLNSIVYSSVCNVAVVAVLLLLHNMLWRVVLSSWSPSQHVLSGAKCNYLFTLFIRHLATRGGFTGTPVSGEWSR